MEELVITSLESDENENDRDMPSSLRDKLTKDSLEFDMFNINKFRISPTAIDFTMSPSAMARLNLLKKKGVNPETSQVSNFGRDENRRNSSRKVSSKNDSSNDSKKSNTVIM